MTADNFSKNISLIKMRITVQFVLSSGTVMHSWCSLITMHGSGMRWNEQSHNQNTDNDRLGFDEINEKQCMEEASFIII